MKVVQEWVILEEAIQGYVLEFFIKIAEDCFLAVYKKSVFVLKSEDSTPGVRAFFGPSTALEEISVTRDHGWFWDEKNIRRIDTEKGCFIFQEGEGVTFDGKPAELLKNIAYRI